MDLSKVKAVPHKNQKKKRVGRGTGSDIGKTCGRGHNGARSRSGWSERNRWGGQIPLWRRLPKWGFNNADFRKDYEIVNVQQLRHFEEGTEVTPELLEESGLVKQPPGGRVKILGDGNLDRALTVKAHAFSDSASQKIEDAGGTAEIA